MSEIIYPERVPLACTPTPLVPLERLSKLLGGPTIYVKRDDLTGSLLSGNKVRKLEFLLADAIAVGATHVITSGGVQSNHARATAFAAAQLGLKCRLVLREDSVPANEGNFLLDQLAGAEIFSYSKADYIGQFDRLIEMHCAIVESEKGTPYVIPTGGSNALGMWGYIRCADELHEQIKQQGLDVSDVVCATGSVGTQAGLATGFSILDTDYHVTGIAVCDDEPYFTQRIRDDQLAWQQSYSQGIEALMPTTNVSTDDRFIGPGYAQAGPEVYSLIQEIAQLEGLLLDPVYTGKAFYGLIERIKKGEFNSAKDIVFVHTGGMFGVFSHNDKFSF